MPPTSPRRHFALLLLLAAACGGGGSGAGPQEPPPVEPPPFAPLVDLRADVNRDGVADLADPGDEAGEEAWTEARGAIFLANLDDDLGRCGLSLLDRPEFSDAALAACHDAADEEVNGEEDLADLAPLRTAPWPAAPDDAVGRLAVTPPAAASRVRLFRRAAGALVAVAPGAELPPSDLRAGLELWLEGRDVVRDAAWDGLADVTFTVERRGAPATGVRDTVRLRLAPIVISHHLSPAEEVYAPVLAEVVPGDAGDVAASAAFRAALGPLAAAAGAALLPLPPAGSDLGLPWRDRWAQDLFETGYMARPTPGGQHVVRVILRSPFVESPNAVNASLRRTSRIAYALRGRDRAVVQQHEPGHPPEMQTLNSLGNLEVVPPHVAGGVAYPHGRLLLGSAPAFHPDPSFVRLLEAQGVQPPILVDTSWLQVAHVDEVLAFLPSIASPRGWVLLANDPALARRMLQDLEAAGHGGATLFTGRAWRGGAPAELTVAAALADPDVTARTAAAATRMDEMKAVLRAALELGDADVIPAPFLHHGEGARSAAFQPGTANLLVLSPSLVVVADPHGPLVDGVDPFKAQLEQALAPHGLTVAWIDEWDLLHRFVGEVHCGTNALRAVPSAPWWAGGG
jgi:protein-arginine deiminase